MTDIGILELKVVICVLQTLIFLPKFTVLMAVKAKIFTVLNTVKSNIYNLKSRKIVKNVIKNMLKANKKISN